MPGAPEALYVDARRALLDALDALQPHHAAIVLVGAQAVYVHAGDIESPVAPYTTDGDLGLDPALLAPLPTLDAAMRGAGFVLTDQPGIWLQAGGSLTVDLLVPEGIAAPGGRRGVRIEGHGRLAARKVKGLEGCLVDLDTVVFGALEAGDRRTFPIRVAGPAGLLVSKLHKLHERLQSGRQVESKNAYDIYRLLRATSTADMAARYRHLLEDSRSEDVAGNAVAMLRDLFSGSDAPGSQLAASYVEFFGDAPTVAAACVALATDLLAAL